MKIKPKTLSDAIIYLPYNNHITDNVIMVKDVKVFIKEFKDLFLGSERVSYNVSYIQREIDKLIGKELLKN